MTVDALRFGLEREGQRGVHDQPRLQRARLRAVVRHADEDQVVARRAAGLDRVHARQGARVQLAGQQRLAVRLRVRRKDPEAVQNRVLVRGLRRGFHGDLDLAVAVGVLRVEPEGRRLVLADVGDGIDGLRLGAFHAQHLHALAGFLPPPFAQRQRHAARRARRHGQLVMDVAAHVDGDVPERRIQPGGRLGPVAIHAARIEALQRRGRRRRVGLPQIGDGERLLHDLQPVRRAQRPHDGHARRKQFLLLPHRAADHLHADARGELASALAVVVEQFAAAIHERLVRVVRQADGRLPLRRRVAEIHGVCDGPRGRDDRGSRNKDGKSSDSCKGESVHGVVRFWFRVDATSLTQRGETRAWLGPIACQVACGKTGRGLPPAARM